MDKEILLKRLSLIKYLYKQGVEISNRPETIAFHSILLFHDSVEMFLKLAATYKNMRSDKFSFMEYWIQIPELTLKASMDSFNKLRVNLKHHGQIPSKVDLETSRVNTTDFFHQNTQLIFGVDFSQITIFDLVIYSNVKQYLINAQTLLEANKFSDSVEEVTKAFYELIDDYKESKSDYRHNQFEFTKHIRFDRWGELKPISKPIEEMARDINDNFKTLNQALEIIALGIDYRKFTKFKMLTPIVHRFDSGEYHMEIWGEKIWDKDNCQFLIDFVLESAIKMQEFDYNIDSVHPEEEFIVEIKETDIK
jgi:hypothetical protein